MSFILLVDLTVAYVQYMYVLLSTSPMSFPQFYIEPFQTLRFFFLELIENINELDRYKNPFGIEVPFWIPLDYRLRFAVVCLIAPLLVSLFGIFTLHSSEAFLWILTLLFTLFITLLGVFLLAEPYLRKVNTISMKLSLLLLIFGSVLTLTLIIIGIFYLIVLWRRKRKEREALFADKIRLVNALSPSVSLIQKRLLGSKIDWLAMAALQLYEKKEKQYKDRYSLKNVFVQAFLGIISALAGAVLFGLVPISGFSFFQGSKTGRNISYFFFATASIAFVWIILSFFAKGREFQLCISTSISSIFVCLLLLLLSAFYNPVLMHLVGILWCKEVKCKPGERLFFSGSLVRSQTSSQTWGSPENPCCLCDFSMYQQQCPASLQQKLCGTFITESRLAVDYSVPCSEINMLYKMAAAVVMVAYTVAYPIFLVVVTNRCSKMLEKEYPLDQRLCDEFTKKELYSEKVSKSMNVASSIYSGYKHNYRNARVTFLFYKVFLVLTSYFTRNGLSDDLAWIGMSLVILVSFLYFLYIAACRPFARPVGNLYSASHQLMLVAVAIIGLLGNINDKDTLPFFATVLVAVLIFFAPLTALLIGLFWTFRKELGHAKRLQRRLESGFVFLNKNAHNSSLSRATSCSDVAVDNNNTNNQVNNDEPNVESKNNNINIKRREKTEFNGPKKITGGNPFWGQNGLTAASRELETKSTRQSSSVDGEVTFKNAVIYQNCGSVVRRKRSSIFSINFSKNENDEFEKFVDDYFSDERLFLPGAYFRGFRSIPIATLPNSEEAEKQDARRDSAKNEKTTAYGAMKGTISHFIFKGKSNFVQRRASQKDEVGEDDKLPTTQQQKQSPEQRGENKGQYVTNNSEEESGALEPAWGKVVGWWKKWQKLFRLGTMPLRYGDVIARRKELKKSSGIFERPFWIDPSAIQQQTYRTVGNLLPCFCAKGGNDAKGFTSSCDGKSIFVSCVKAAKNKTYPPLVTSKDVTSVPVDNEKLVSNADALQLFCSDARGFAAFTPSLNKEVGCLPCARESDVFLRKPTESVGESRADVHVNANKLGTKILEDSSSVRTLLQPLIFDAQCKLDHLLSCCPRELENKYQENCFLLRFAPVIPKVCLKSMNVENWDTFLDEVFEEISASQSTIASLFRVSLPDSGRILLKKRNERENNKATAPLAAAKEHAEEDDVGCQTVEANNVEGRVILPQKETNAQSSTEQNVQLLKRHFILRRYLNSAFKNQRELLRLLQRAVDFCIAVTFKKYMNVFFIILAIFTAMALLLWLRALLGRQSNLFVDGVRQENTVEHQLMRYNSWESFTRHCCCLSVTNITPMYPYYVLDVENWLCDDGSVKERVRRNLRESGVIDGYRVRELCGMTFTNGCMLTVTDKKTVELNECEKTITEDEKERW